MAAGLAAPRTRIPARVRRALVCAETTVVGGNAFVCVSEHGATFVGPDSTPVEVGHYFVAADRVARRVAR